MASAVSSFAISIGALALSPWLLSLYLYNVYRYNIEEKKETLLSLRLAPELSAAARNEYKQYGEREREKRADTLRKYGYLVMPACLFLERARDTSSAHSLLLLLHLPFFSIFINFFSLVSWPARRVNGTLTHFHLSYIILYIYFL